MSASTPIKPGNRKFSAITYDIRFLLSLSRQSPMRICTTTSHSPSNAKQAGENAP
jgi:hypothetical protein